MDNLIVSSTSLVASTARENLIFVISDNLINLLIGGLIVFCCAMLWNLLKDSLRR